MCGGCISGLSISLSTYVLPIYLSLNSGCFMWFVACDWKSKRKRVRDSKQKYKCEMPFFTSGLPPLLFLCLSTLLCWPLQLLPVWSQVITWPTQKTHELCSLDKHTSHRVTREDGCFFSLSLFFFLLAPAGLHCERDGLDNRRMKGEEE